MPAAFWRICSLQREFRSLCLTPMILEQIPKNPVPTCMSLAQRLRDQQMKEKAQVSQIKMAEDDRTDRRWIQFAENVKRPLPWLSNRFCVHIRFKANKNDTQVFLWRDHFHTVDVNDALLCYASVSPEINHWLFGFQHIQVENQWEHFWHWALKKSQQHNVVKRIWLVLLYLSV